MCSTAYTKYIQRSLIGKKKITFMPLKIRDLIDRIGYPELGIRNLIIFHLIWQTFLNLQKTKMTKSPEISRKKHPLQSVSTTIL